MQDFSYHLVLLSSAPAAQAHLHTHESHTHILASNQQPVHRKIIDLLFLDHLSQRHNMEEKIWRNFCFIVTFFNCIWNFYPFGLKVLI